MAKIKFNIGDPRVIGLIGFLIYTTFSIVTVPMPVAVSDYVQKFYDFGKSLPPGANVFICSSIGPDMIGDAEPNYILIFKFSIQQEWNVIVFSTWAQGDMIMQKMLKKVYGLDYQKNPLYGTQIIDLGMQPGQTVMMQTMAEQGIRAYAPTDRFGTPLDQLSGAQGFDKADTWDMGVSIGTTAWFNQHAPVTWLMYGIPCMHVEHIGGLNMLMADWTAGNLKGEMCGVKQAAEFESLTGLSGGAMKYMTAVTAISLYSMVTIAVVNIYMVGIKKTVGLHAERFRRGG